MKKITALIVVLACLFTMPPLGFAGTLEPVKETAPATHESMFLLREMIAEGSVPSEGQIDNMAYSPTEDAYYVILNKNIVGPVWAEMPAQWVFSADGNLIENPQYPELEDMDRGQIDFDGDDVYSVERSYWAYGEIYRLGGETPVKMSNRVNERSCKGVLARNGSLADFIFYMNYGYHNPSYPIFSMQIGMPVETRMEDSIRVFDNRFYRVNHKVTGYDFTVDGKQVVYGGVINTETDWGQEIRIVRFEGLEAKDYRADKGEGVLADFTLKLPQKPVTEDKLAANLELKGLYTTEEHIVVLMKVGALNQAYLQRYSLAGELIDQTQVAYSTAAMTEGPNGDTVYLRQSPDAPEPVWELVACAWPKEETEKKPRSAAMPRPMVTEHHAGGKTIAVYDNNKFGLVKKQNEETGELSYWVPLRTQDNQVTLRIPYGDLAGTIGKGADNVLIAYHGQEISIPMADFACEDVFAGMAHQTEARFDIQLVKMESGPVKVSVDLVTIEQVDEKTKRVYRESIQ